ncbi:MAG TPA: saccharopine dehydrogenase NADP-binding domain-containing protein [Herminiimonas sp.]|nr:saccharopine dehydrogenase NADP-binding domain-containing protein [Herminiimonas sp.]
MKIIVLGGYGNFGARICRALVNTPDIELIVAGRSAERAAAFATELGHGAGSMRIDLSQSDLAATLRDAKAELIVHTAGPFQQQGYAVPLAVAQAGAHYIDLADGRRFVCDFPLAMDAAFRAAGKLAISGASTVPALSSAVVNHLTENWKHIDAIDFCIAPAQTAPRGIATMAAVLGYCGAPIEVWRDGAWQTQYGWADPARIQFKRLQPRLGALCDIPDLEIFPKHYPGVRSVMFRAALEIGISQRMFAALAFARRVGLISHPEKFAHVINTSARYADFLGSSLGGMVVRVTGVDGNGVNVRRAWHIAADNDHGPEIPCMAAILLARGLAENRIKDVGAYTSTGRLALKAFEPEFARWGMVTDVVEEGAYLGA